MPFVTIKFFLALREEIAKVPRPKPFIQIWVIQQDEVDKEINVNVGYQKRLIGKLQLLGNLWLHFTPAILRSAL